MSETPKTADAVLVTLPDVDGQGRGQLLGKSLALRQFELARMLGCSRLIVLGNDLSPEGMDLRHKAEKAGMIFQVASGPHALMALLAPQDRLLVLHPYLQAETTALFADVPEQGMVVTVPAAAGVEAGFERIDLTRAWAGVLILRGGLLSRLLDLAEDSETAPALLRIALQAGLPERMLDQSLLAEGRWSLPGGGPGGGPDGGEEMQIAEERWIERHLGTGRPGSLSAWIARQITRRFARQMLSRAALLPVLLIGAVLLAGAAGYAGWSGQAIAAFAMIGLSALTLEVAITLSRLRAAPFGSAGPWDRLRLFIDVMFLTAAVLLVQGPWFRQMFAPLVLMSGLYQPVGSAPRSRFPDMRDRALLGGGMAVLAAFLPAEQVVMAAAMAVLAVNLIFGLKRHG
ncbi:hypothetical protein GCM10009127_20900 [Alteraurantiacibacter aestuarii]|uniref:hypothetical protein n=1 Tax=Alteraurantiacibacter aestuarii TaxID=650004 RepID=UPI0031CE6339